MNRIIKGRSHQIVTAIQHFKKQVGVEFALVFILTVAILIFAQQGFIRAQHSELVTSDTPTFQLHHVTLSVSDVEQVSQWYVDKLGFTVSDRFTLTRPDNSQIQVVRIEIPGLQMNISEFDGSIPPNRAVDEQGWRHLALQVDRVDQIYQRLQAEGVQFLTEPFTYDPPGYRIAFFRDPEGNVLELYQDL